MPYLREYIVNVSEALNCSKNGDGERFLFFRFLKR
jgi:hypothetical protein